MRSSFRRKSNQGWCPRAAPRASDWSKFLWLEKSQSPKLIPTNRKNRKSDKSPSQIRNPKLQIGLLEPLATIGEATVIMHVQFEISDFGFEMGFCPISQFLNGCRRLAALLYRPIHPLGT